MASNLITSLIVLALLGIVDSGYLIWKRFKNQSLVCPIGGHDCNAVVESKWSSIFGIKNDVLGFFYYIVLIISAVWFFSNPFPLLTYFLLMASFIALAVSVYLFYVQKYILKQYCFYCLISALINLLIFLNIILFL